MSSTLLVAFGDPCYQSENDFYNVHGKLTWYLRKNGQLRLRNVYGNVVSAFGSRFS